MSGLSPIEELSACEDSGFVSLTLFEEPKQELLITVEVTDPERVFKIRWPSHIAFALRSEHYCQWDNDENWTGKHVFRVYSKSTFVDFVGAATFASNAFPGAFTHYQVQSLYQIIDVASQDAPEVSVELRT